MLFEEFTEGHAAAPFSVGDPVIITGNVEYRGKTGDVRQVGRDGAFVVVDLYNYGPHSFHASDVSYNDYADSDEEAEYQQGVAEGQTPEREIERLKLRQNAEHGGASLKRQAATQSRIRELEKQIKDKKSVAEQEKVGNMPADKFDDAMARLKQLAGSGPLKTVWDPQKRVYKNVPTAVQPKK